MELIHGSIVVKPFEVFQISPNVKGTHKSEPSLNALHLKRRRKEEWIDGWMHGGKGEVHRWKCE